MKILHVLPTRTTSYGGPVRVAESIVDYLQSEGHETRIYPFEGEQPKGKLFVPSLAGLKKLKADVIWADIVHMHGLWNLPATLAGIFARQSKTPYVVNPHGMLDRWSLQQSSGVKKVYSALFERKNLLSAAGLCCTHREEMEEAAQFEGFSNVFIIPNGIDVKVFDGLPDRKEMDLLYPQVEGKVVLFFMARIHYKKGLDLLIKACSLLHNDSNQFHLMIAGEDEGGHLPEIRELINELNLNNHITFVGEVLTDKKRVLLGGSDIFALTSRQEGDSIAIKEAMASGLPLLISRQCHYPEFEDMGLGKVVSTECEDIAKALQLMLDDITLRKQMGAKARSYVEEHVDRKIVNQDLVEIYDDIIHARSTSSAWQTS